ncbi:Type 1 glutamine amidotransferase-like domain-containing protein [Planococcus salinarum]|uniref:Type 1 glutamine amidotransferase-like domain-containing protein n=1 Tax=Planococcus salinarum TaxID=622695 RepID=UPI000E3E7577|nr:Type 1 glutamine amidotransferase-like domain-containing protein [Planococcus salinarum]TAA72597.1 hypothetical protein D2909_05345 [Planococcus salinarum]
MGKLFFYSDQVRGTPGNERLDQLLLEGLDPEKLKIAYIPSTEDRDKTYFKLKAQYYSHYGIREMMFFDLFSEYDPAQMEPLLKCDIIHLSSGNPIELRKALEHRGMDELLREYFNHGGTLVGVSAGAVQFGKSAKLFQLFIGDSGEKINALQMVDFDFLPHYNRWDEAYKKKVRAYAETSGTTVYAGNDGDGLIVDNGKIQLIGDITVINGNQN